MALNKNAKVDVEALKMQLRASQIDTKQQHRYDPRMMPNPSTSDLNDQTINFDPTLSH